MNTLKYPLLSNSVVVAVETSIQRQEGCCRKRKQVKPNVMVLPNWTVVVCAVNYFTYVKAAGCKIKTISWNIRSCLSVTCSLCFWVTFSFVYTCCAYKQAQDTRQWRIPPASGHTFVWIHVCIKYTHTCMLAPLRHYCLHCGMCCIMCCVI